MKPSIFAFLAVLAAPAAAFAGEETTSSPTDATPTKEETQPKKEDVKTAAPDSKERATDATPKPLEAAPTLKQRFTADPIGDVGLILGSLGFAVTLDMINGTGEIRPQQISSSFQTSHLLAIDRTAVHQTPDPNARMFSNLGLFAAVGFAVVDPFVSGLREKSVQTALVDAMIYAEAASITLSVTNLAKMAVRRPRPQAYIDFEAHKNDPNYSNAETDSSLSFFSGHASMVASISATATYLAFVRSPNTARPWITLVAGTALTSFVSVERVRGAAHFPTDVIAGGIAGAGIGILVAHLHRTDELKQRRIWVGAAPEKSGGSLQLSGFF